MAQNKNDQTQAQLNMIKEMNAIFAKFNGHFWLRGGWAIDFILGEVTRPHEDLDLVTWVHHRDILERELIELGYKRIPVSDRQTDFVKAKIDIQFLYLNRALDGAITPNGLPEWEWRIDALQKKEFTLHGISAYVLSPSQLLEEKNVYEQIGRKPRPKDIESKEILQNIISSNRE
ncbi:hypothetical protein GC096_27745 [Paenibacillus sp. LMG 31461]|uniref:Aminoglycoside adenylyltransferase n=1 Tax=Paenibacillus plantarum TaxID=2654975 RepID=A0ABX1XHQ1_9BACL|nr:hypothetical protein [Paenibacillus plantarum]NOU67824.1 hypothetical protein [Paenibacillus plantarum]